MFKSYFMTAWRNISRSKGYSALNILGLATGMAVALLIGLWVYFQYSFDRFLPDYGQLYQVRRNFNSNGELLTFSSTSLKLADALRRDIPEIETVAEGDGVGPHGLMAGDKKVYFQGSQINGNFLQAFQFPLLQGNAGTALKDPYSIVLTESVAKALFGNENPLNKTVRFDNRDNLTVTGVLKDVPANSSLQFKYLVPFSYLEQTDANVKADRTSGFGNNGYSLYVRLKPGVSYARVAAKIKDIEKGEKDDRNAMLSDVIMQPMQDWHLFSGYENGKATGGFIDYVRLFSIIGVLVLAIACINFVNLTTARSEKRAKEVGIRKAIGSGRKDLVIQFLIESGVITFMAFGVSLLLVQLALPAFNLLTGDEIAIPFANPIFWVVTLACVFLTGMAAGSRPAFYLSAFHPVKVLKGSLGVGREATLPRKILVVLQFSCSVALIVSTIIVYQQINYVRNRPTGYAIDRLMMTDMNEDIGRNYTSLKNELVRDGIVDHMTLSSSPITGIYQHSDLDHWPGKQAGETVEMGVVTVTDDYFKTVGIPLAQGRDFEGKADTASVIFNETAIRRLRLQNPLNQVIKEYGGTFRIVGVAKDALMASPFAPAEPTMFLYQTGGKNVVMYHLSPRIETADAITRLTAVFNKYCSAYPYSYQFADQSYAAKFNLEVLVGKLAGLFAGLAIFISCLGLFGLAAYVAEQRTKEVGVRKVLGASVSQLWLLLSKDFIVLVVISCVIATPVALYFLQGWLRQYTYRIQIGPWAFILAALIAICITIGTISVQAIRAALMNPVKSLRSE